MPSNYVDLSSGLVRDYIPVTPNNDTDNLSINDYNTLVGFYVTVGGNIVFTVDGVDRTVTVNSFAYFPCSGATRVKAAGTTATGIFALVI